MSDHPPFRKVFDGVATQQQMFQLFDRHHGAPGNDPLLGTPYDGEWFELQGSSYYFMLDLLPPLFMRTGMFGLSEYKAGYITSVFFAIRIRGRERWFHGFCNLLDRRSPDAMRAAIIAHETGVSDGMTRAEKLEAIWSATPPERKGIAGDEDPEAFPVDQLGRRAVLIDTEGQGLILKRLEGLSEAEIEDLLAVSRMRRKPRS